MKRCIHGGNFWENGIDFSANINPKGLPAQIKSLLRSHFNDILHYPAPYSDALRRAIAQYVGLRRENILTGNGSIELIYLIFERLRPASTLLARPAFNEYEYAARTFGSEVRFFNERENRISRIKDLLKNCGLLFICNPNNPTGYLFPNDFIYEALEILKKRGGTLVIDEAFIEFVCDTPTFIYEVKNYNNLIILRSFTKFFSIAGLRLGYLAATKKLREKIEKAQYPWSVNVIAQKAAEALLKEKEFFEESKAYVQKERNYLFSELNKLKGLTAYPPSANFIFCKAANGRRLCKDLSARGLFIRNLADFRGLNENFIRLAVRTHAENVRLIKNLKVLL